MRVLDFGLARGQRAPRGRGAADVSILSTAVADAAVSATTKTQLDTAERTKPPTGALDASLTRPGALMGTPAYMAPEQISCGDLGPAADQFSFCVALYEALYKDRPFAGETVGELSQNLIAGNVIEPPRASRVPSWIWAVLRRGLQSEASARFPSMELLLLELGRDPSIARRRWLSAATSVALTGLAGAGLYSMVTQPAGVAPCESAEEELAEVWSDTRRDAVTRSLAEVALPYADALRPRLVAGLEGYATRWTEMHKDACMAHERGAQSSELLDRRMLCLARRKTALDSAAEVLSTADPRSFERAPEMLEKLPAIASCGDLELLTAERPPPEDPALAAAVIDVQRSLDRARTLLDAGRNERAATLSQEALTRAESLQHPPLLAEALLAHGAAQLESHHIEKAAPALRKAALEGIASDSDAIAAEALARQLYIGGLAAGDEDSVTRELELAEALMRKLPERSPVREYILNNAGAVMLAKGDRAGARGYFERALEHQQRVGADASVMYAETTFNLGLASDSPAEAEERISRARSLLEQRLGSAHPKSLAQRIAAARVTLDLDRAFEHADAACRAQAEHYPENPAKLVYCLELVAQLARERGDHARALATYKRAIPLLEDALALTEQFPWIPLQLAHARGAAALLEEDPATAIAALEQALAELPEQRPWWLDEHVAGARLILGEALLAAKRPREAIRSLEESNELLARFSETTHEAASERLLARARLSLARAHQEALASDDASTDEERARDAQRADALLREAERWYNAGGSSYARQRERARQLRAGQDGEAPRLRRSAR